MESRVALLSLVLFLESELRRIKTRQRAENLKLNQAILLRRENVIKELFAPSRCWTRIILGAAGADSSSKELASKRISATPKKKNEKKAPRDIPTRRRDEEGNHSRGQIKKTKITSREMFKTAQPAW